MRTPHLDLAKSTGVKVAGHRGYFLLNDGIDLNQALISYGLDFLRKKGYKKIQPPFMMRRHHMAKTAQLEDFDESLYKLEGEGSAADAAPAAAATTADSSDGDKYLIATSEQPISAYHAGEWFDNPSEQLPLRSVHRPAGSADAAATPASRRASARRPARTARRPGGSSACTSSRRSSSSASPTRPRPGPSLTG